MTDTLIDAGDTLFAGQPVRIVERDGVRYTLLGTAHVSQASVEAVERAIESGRFDAVAVELDAQRLQALTDPDALAKLDLVEVIRKGRVALFAANLALAAYQRRLAEQLEIEPGAELKRAVTLANERNLPVHLIDREVGLTFRRASQRLGFFGKIKLVMGLGAGLFASEEVGEDEIEKLKQGDMLEASFGEFASESPALYETIIGERDRYMATRLREVHDPAQREVLAVVGAGHLAGLARYLETDTDAPGPLRESLEDVPKKRNIPWITLAILAIVLTGIGVGFYRGGLGVGSELLAVWAMYTGGLAGLGCLLAGSHPLSILTAIVVAPFKPFRLSIPTGAFSALVEARLRKPAYEDFLKLRDDAQSVKGWYRNRVTRVVLTFMLTNLGSMLGLWLTGFQVWGKVAG
ncbi:MAG: TraB/GumN family protein [Stenotrophomonas sp.]|uniref:Pheromone shutdown-related protein TraB n=2 Tax=Stenotrophomonas rhizophila TaxID=216778 RepID=A0AAW5PJW5_9GAMM|nr:MULTISPECIES: TraB/GumN family protein [Stenotrophomonas]MCS4280404.1 pheromone shutdown-related protein TraB [Stenotrophomonas rhizophila]ROP79941.1 pheromone shutdown-related protein TraB [Stenotrophomonas rhizophila]HAU82159.1 conjugal transfer protein TraB [Stenotrophomonas sp.]